MRAVEPAPPMLAALISPSGRPVAQPPGGVHAKPILPLPSPRCAAGDVLSTRLEIIEKLRTHKGRCYLVLANPQHQSGDGAQVTWWVGSCRSGETTNE